MDVLLNNKKINFSPSDLPILISGKEKTGSSFFTVCLLANLLKDGHKVILFSAHSAAKEEFRNQIKTNSENAMIIYSEDENDFINIIKNIPDLSERVVLIKNIDAYSQKLLEAIKNLKLIIFSGDLDNCQFADELLKNKIGTKIFFSYSKKDPIEGLESLPKYSGKIISKKYSGTIKLDV